MIPSSGLCVGLDLDRAKLPAPYVGQPNDLQRFACDVIDAVRPFATCFKINVAFYEKYGRPGIDALYAVREHCAGSYVILDAKRGDIGNTSAAYAVAGFDDLHADAITVAPYMGRDSVEPFLAHEGKMVYVLGLTSNPGSHDFQRLDSSGMPLYERVMRTALTWERSGDLGFVVGATDTKELAHVRGMFPDVPFLIPGIGSQGGDASESMAANGGGPAVFNVSRGLLYIDPTESCIQSISAEARRLHDVLMSR
ncbi:MAG: orotidine-5'-phosphate decarboxylase [Candidatus Kapabacteria bacterium]|nr:orotidine-5'-phosphate decarboxylase [Candidatus Kapabacteria bacterium]